MRKAKQSRGGEGELTKFCAGVKDKGMENATPQGRWKMRISIRLDKGRGEQH